jgi:hypothetical protein
VSECRNQIDNLFEEKPLSRGTPTNLFSWLAPDGTFHPVVFPNMHVLEAPKLVGHPEMEPWAALKLAFKEGWARVVRSGDNALYAQHDGPLTYRQSRELKDLAVENELRYVLVCTDNGAAKIIWSNEDDIGGSPRWHEDIGPVYFAGYVVPESCMVTGEGFGTRAEAQHSNVPPPAGYPRGDLCHWRFRSDTGELFFWTQYNEEMEWAVRGWLKKRGHIVKQVSTIGREDSYNKGGEWHRSHGYYYAPLPVLRQIRDPDYYGIHGKAIGDSFTRKHIDTLLEAYWCGYADPQGKMHSVDADHESWAKEHIVAEDDFYVGDPLLDAMKMGWCRVANDNCGTLWADSYGLNRAQKATLERLGIGNEFRVEDQHTGQTLYAPPVSEGWEGGSVSSYWMSPSCRLANVSEIGHCEGGWHILAGLGEPVGKNDWEDIYGQMFKLGWVRLIIDRDDNQIYCEGRITGSQLSKLKDMAIERRMKLVRKQQWLSKWKRVAEGWTDATKNLMRAARGHGIKWDRWGHESGYNPFFRQVQIPKGTRGTNSGKPMLDFWHEVGHDLTRKLPSTGFHPLAYKVNPSLAATREREANRAVRKLIPRMGGDKKMQGEYGKFANEMYGSYVDIPDLPRWAKKQMPRDAFAPSPSFKPKSSRRKK